MVNYFNLEISTEKVCTSCFVLKPLEEFHVHNALQSGRHPRCKTCRNAYEKTIRIKTKDTRAAYSKFQRARNRDRFNRDGVVVVSKICHTCGVYKSVVEFNIHKSQPDGLDYSCKQCLSHYNRYRGLAHNDKRKGFDVCSFEEYMKVSNLSCTYCSLAPSMGADRVNNSKGHIMGNMLPCCDYCNIARSNHFTVEEMKTEIGPAIARIRQKRKEAN